MIVPKRETKSKISYVPTKLMVKKSLKCIVLTKHTPDIPEKNIPMFKMWEEIHFKIATQEAFTTWNV